MPKLTILRGLSGSGKSTWAEAQAGHPAIVSRDRIRVSLFGTEAFIDEDLVTKVEHATIAAALRGGRDAISDNTNIEFKYVKAIAEIGHKVGADVQVKVFDVDFDTALLRNRVRAQNGGRDVPEDVIRKQRKRFDSTKHMQLDEPVVIRPYHGTPGKPKAFMVDLDGTLFHMNGKRGPYDLNVDVDDVDEVVANIVAKLAEASARVEGWRLETEYVVIAMSGRKESARAASIEALDRELIPFDHLIMRADHDNRKDSIVKMELFDKYVRDNFDVKFVLDDRNQVVDMWRAMGIKCLQVAEGDF